MTPQTKPEYYMPGTGSCKDHIIVFLPFWDQASITFETCFFLAGEPPNRGQYRPRTPSQPPRDTRRRTDDYYQRDPGNRQYGQRSQDNRWNRPRQTRYNDQQDYAWEQASRDFVQWWDEQVRTRGYPQRTWYVDQPQEPTNRPRAPWRQNQRYADHQRYADQQYQQPHNTQRWRQQANGYWLDTQPQWPWESIFYYQPSHQRIMNERYLYGYSFDMGL